MKTFLAAIFAFLFSATAQAQVSSGFGCDVAGGWPGSQYGLTGLLLTDALPCYGVTGTKNSKVVLQTAPSITAPLTITGATSLALAIGRQGIVQPALQVDTSTGGTTITGVEITAESTGNGVNINAIGETNVPLIINAAGSGTIDFGTSSTGLVISFQSFVLKSGIISQGTVPVGTTGSCVASSFVGGSVAGKFSAAVCAGGTIILSSLPAATNGYTCNAQDQTTPADTLKQTANTTTSATFTATTVAADVVVFNCMGW